MSHSQLVYKKQIVRSVLLFVLAACISIVVLILVSCSISYTQKYPNCSTLWFMLKNNDLEDKSLVPYLDLQYERCRKQILEVNQ